MTKNSVVQVFRWFLNFLDFYIWRLFNFPRLLFFFIIIKKKNSFSLFSLYLSFLLSLSPFEFDVYSPRVFFFQKKAFFALLFIVYLLHDNWFLYHSFLFLFFLLLFIFVLFTSILLLFAFLFPDNWCALVELFLCLSWSVVCADTESCWYATKHLLCVS